MSQIVKIVLDNEFEITSLSLFSEDMPIISEYLFLESPNGYYVDHNSSGSNLVIYLYWDFIEDGYLPDKVIKAVVSIRTRMNRSDKISNLLK